MLFAALFWRRSTKWGALAVALWVAFAVIYTWRVPGALAWYGLMPVVPMTLISCALMVVVSLVDAAAFCSRRIRRYLYERALSQEVRDE